ncbi:WH2 motif domain-containing protein [Ditylenchus destructor]|uniref:WH2 motif domain-containing protein n=1 Tax=Ditylenchus destructor TaxID=166010 RepID=A0AAD4N9N5_9BILA|nr:WH2 motif domain-containing protein [Ditylenchus destructor]
MIPGHPVLEDIRKGFKLRPTKTIDKSRPIIQAEGEAIPTVILTEKAPIFRPQDTADNSLPHLNATRYRSHSPSFTSQMPPPPPPPILNGTIKSNSNPIKVNITPAAAPVDRDALLRSIKSGVRLRKTVTNDKSAPILLDEEQLPRLSRPATPSSITSLDSQGMCTIQTPSSSSGCDDCASSGSSSGRFSTTQNMAHSGLLPNEPQSETMNGGASDSEAESLFSYSSSSGRNSSIFGPTQRLHPYDNSWASKMNPASLSPSPPPAPPPPFPMLQTSAVNNKSKKVSITKSEDQQSKKSDYYFDENSLKVTKETLQSEIPAGSAQARIAAFRRFENDMAAQSSCGNNIYSTLPRRSASAFAGTNQVRRPFQDNFIRNETVTPAKQYPPPKKTYPTTRINQWPPTSPSDETACSIKSFGTLNHAPPLPNTLPPQSGSASSSLCIKSHPSPERQSRAWYTSQRPTNQPNFSAISSLASIQPITNSTSAESPLTKSASASSTASSYYSALSTAAGSSYGDIPNGNDSNAFLSNNSDKSEKTVKFSPINRVQQISGNDSALNLLQHMRSLSASPRPMPPKAENERPERVQPKTNQHENPVPVKQTTSYSCRSTFPIRSGTAGAENSANFHRIRQTFDNTAKVAPIQTTGNNYSMRTSSLARNGSKAAPKSGEAVWKNAATDRKSQWPYSSDNAQSNRQTENDAKAAQLNGLEKEDAEILRSNFKFTINLDGDDSQCLGIVRR